MLDENGVTGEVPVDDGRLAGVQVAAERERGSESEREKRSLGEESAQTLSSPESRQDLCAPAFPGLREAKPSKKKTD